MVTLIFSTIEREDIPISKNKIRGEMFKITEIC
jgi:hypothetical protein